MPIIRVPHDKDNPAVEVVRTTAQNCALSYEALGMLTYLLSQKDDWVVVVDDLIREGCGRDKAYRILKELTDAGHLQHVRSAAGLHKPPLWAGRTVYEQPFTEKPDTVTPIPEIPDTVKSGNGEPYPEKPDTVKRSATHAGASAESLVFKDLSSQEQKQQQEQKDKSGGGDNADVRAKVFDQYSALTKRGIDNRVVSQQLLADVADYSQEWVDDAVAIAALNGVTNWNYVRKMLRTWKRDGREESRPATVKGKFTNGNGAHAPPVTPAIASTSEGMASTVRQKLAEQKAKQNARS